MTDLNARLKGAARVWFDAGCCVIPAMGDGSKRPFGEWEEFQQRRPGLDEVDGWLDSGQYDGIGIVCGAISGELEMFEIEGRFADADGYDALGMAIIESGYADLWHRLCTGYLERTPSGGFHWIYRVQGEPARKNIRLARRPATPAELEVKPTEKSKVLIETRGEGGFTIVAPSGGRTHPDGTSWEWVSGKPADIPVLSAEQRDALHAIASTFDSLPAQEWTPKEGKERQEGDPLRPGDDYNDRADWTELLEAHEWTYVKVLRDGSAAWRRPGKTVGISATVGHGDTDRLHVFSSGAYPLEADETYSKFAVYAAYEHGGDFSEAARALAEDGYGDPLPAYVGDTAESFAPLLGVPEQRDAEGEPRPATEKDVTARLHEMAVQKHLADLRAREEAKRLYATERAAAEFRIPPSVLTLREQLLQPREATRYAIESLLPVHGNALLTAQYKTGKTTFITALLKAYADSELFLGRFAVHPKPGRIAVWNYELSQAQYDEWLEQAGIVNTDAVSVLHLRGFRLPLTAPKIEDWCVSWLRDHDVSMWIADPFARAAVGTDENSNTEVGVWLDTFDVIKERAGVSEGVLPVHTGRAEQEHGQERARGATRLDDWADVRWLLTKDDDGNRFFRATGRDVEIAEEKLTFDPATRGLTIGGGDRKWERMRALEEAVVAYVRANPGSSSAAVEKGVEGKADGVRSALRAAIATHRIRVEEGAKNARNHYAN